MPSNNSSAPERTSDDLKDWRAAYWELLEGLGMVEPASRCEPAPEPMRVYEN
jgi:hypothetical protein